MSASAKQRIVVFTTGSGLPGRLALLDRLYMDPALEICAIVVDQHKVKLLKRMWFLLRKWGLAEFTGSMLVGALLAVRRVAEALLFFWHDVHIKPASDESYDTFCVARAVPLLKVADINAPEVAKTVEALSADLGVIMGGRVLSSRITDLPRRGTLNIHKHDARKYRGGPQTGYIERVNVETHLGITVHLAIRKVDEGDIIGYDEVEIERFDTDESLELKADMKSIGLCYDCIKGYLDGSLQPQKQDVAQGATYYTSPYWSRMLFWRNIRRRLRRELALQSPGAIRGAGRALFWFVRQCQVWLMLPRLAGLRRRFERDGRAPIIIFNYHGLGNATENWATLPIETFWQQYRYAKRYFDVIGLAEAVARLRSGCNDRTAVVFTFDDGYRSCHRNLLPLVETYNIPASIFVCAGAARDGTLLAHDRDKGYDSAVLMSLEEAKACAQAGIDIGSHALNHEDIGSLDTAGYRRVLQESRSILEQHIAAKVRFFAIPFGGQRNITAQALDEAHKYYDAVVSAYGGYNFPGAPTDFYFQRFSAPSNLTDFIAIVNGVHRLRPFYVNHKGTPSSEHTRSHHGRTDLPVTGYSQ